MRLLVEVLDWHDNRIKQRARSTNAGARLGVENFALLTGEFLLAFAPARCWIDHGGAWAGSIRSTNATTCLRVELLERGTNDTGTPTLTGFGIDRLAFRTGDSVRANAAADRLIEPLAAGARNHLTTHTTT